MTTLSWSASHRARRDHGATTSGVPVGSSRSRSPCALALSKLSGMRRDPGGGGRVGGGLEPLQPRTHQRAMSTPTAPERHGQDRATIERRSSSRRLTIAPVAPWTTDRDRECAHLIDLPRQCAFECAGLAAIGLERLELHDGLLPHGQAARPKRPMSQAVVDPAWPCRRCRRPSWLTHALTDLGPTHRYSLAGTRWSSSRSLIPDWYFTQWSSRSGWTGRAGSRWPPAW